MSSDKKVAIQSFLMPTAGIGCWQSSKGEVGQAIEWAVEAGVKLIDTAYVYMNEAEIGAALDKVLKAGKVKREDLFIVTKLPLFALTPKEVKPYFEKSRKLLGLDYIDLYLVHCPIGTIDDEASFVDKFMNGGKVELDKKMDLIGIWREMEKLVDSGKCRAIGVSNFNSGQLERISKVARIPIAANQVESHAYFQQRELRQTMEKLGIKLMAYGPLGSPGRTPRPGEPTPPNILEDPLVLELAKKYKKTPAQVLLRHLLQLGYIVIPKSVKQHRIKENFSLFDFALTSVDVTKMNALDKGSKARSFSMAFFGTDDVVEEHPEFPFSARDSY